MNNSPSIQFINHASVVIKHDDVALLSDPWYQGDAFHKGWNLLHELNDSEIQELLDQITHIWISHEHPDHFSIMFFKKFGKLIQEKNIEILFQKTKDKRVETFLSKAGYKNRIIDFNNWIKLSNNFEILCIKDGFYDSGLAVKAGDKKILNLNDCEVKDKSRCMEVHQIVGDCNILISQFSYAAWKGGEKNINWRKKAALEKIETLKLQVEYFKPELLIPFASYVYFSNESNSYLNDASNKPQDVIEAFSNHKVKVNVMKPFDVIKNIELNSNNDEAIAFWNNKYEGLKKKEFTRYENINPDELKNSFSLYKERIFKNNSFWFMRIIRLLSPIPAFKPIVIKVLDHNKNYILDLFSKELITTSNKAHLSMQSESFNFLMNNTFGFDTLTVNGCFEEECKSGFSIATRSLAIENLNNIGISVRPRIIFNFRVIFMFISRLFKVAKKIDATS